MSAALLTSLRAGLPVVLAVAGLATLALGIPTCLANPGLAAPSQAGVFLAYLFAIHLAVLLPVCVPSMMLFSAALHRRGDGVSPGAVRVATLAAAVALLAAMNLCLRFTLAYTLFRGGPLGYVRALGAIDLAAFLSAIPVALAWAWLRTSPAGTRTARRLAVGYVILLVVVVAVNRIDEVPKRHDLAPLARAPEAVDATGSPRNVLVLGIDGLSWLVLGPLIERGELPAFASLVESGARAHLDTIVPTFSPIVWTTIATGRSAEFHGVHGFAHFMLPGLSVPIERAPIVSSINWWNGLNRFLGLATRFGLGHQELVASTRWQEPPVWQIAAHHGLSAGVYDWLVTWPVSELANGGYMVREDIDIAAYRTPLSRVRQVLADVADPGLKSPGRPFNADSYLQKIWRRFQTVADESIALHENFRPRLSLAFASPIDAAHHRYWRSGDGGRWLARDELHGPPSQGVAAVYQMVDAWVARFLETVGDDTLVLIVSDHGHSFDGHEHHNAPPGVLLAAGPGVRPGALLDAATIYDVAPTVLAALGLPLSQELEGHVLEGLFVPGALPARQSVARYEGYATGAEDAESRLPEVERQRLEELRALGYVN